MSKENVVIGVLAGIAVGALLGVLFAPDKGSETRKKFSREGSDLADDLKDKFSELMDTLEAVKEEAGKFYEKGMDKAEELKKEAKTHMS